MPTRRRHVGWRSVMTVRTKEDAATFVPKERTLSVLRNAVQKCRGCDLYRYATQAVFGELETGHSATKPKVSIMMIGEQPGDSEDREGRPFVGPAGRLLDQCLEETGIDRQYGQALQMGTAWQATNPQETKYERDSCLSTLVGSRTGDTEADINRMFGRRRSPISLGLELQNHTSSRQSPLRRRACTYRCDAAPIRCSPGSHR